MTIGSNLSLHEEIMLISLRDKEGTVHSMTNYVYAIAGALLAELLLGGRIGVEKSGEERLVDLTDPKPTGDPILDECIEKIGETKKKETVRHWVSRFTRLEGLKHRVAELLCRRGILRCEEEKVLLLFSRKVYPEIDPGPERDLRERLEKAIFSDESEVDVRTALLVSLGNSADLLKLVFDKERLAPRKERIEKIAKGELIGEATREAIEAMQAAVMAVVIRPRVMVH